MNNNAQAFAITEDSQKTDLQIEIENWKGQMNFMAKEIAFYLKMVEFPTIDLKNINFFLKDLHEINKTSDELVKMLLQYNNNLEGLNECDDLQCETYYLDQHEEIRVKIEKHQLRFRTMKSQLFSSAQIIKG